MHFPDVPWAMVPEARSLTGLLVGGLHRILGVSLRRSKAPARVTADFAVVQAPRLGVFSIGWVWLPSTVMCSLAAAELEWVRVPLDPHGSERCQGEERSMWTFLMSIVGGGQAMERSRQ